MNTVHVPVTIYPHRAYKKGLDPRQIIGRYVQVSGLFPLGTPDLSKQQFIGLHDSIVVTITKPDNIRDLFGIATDLISVPEYRSITWLGGVRCYTTAQGFKVYISSKYWNPADPMYNKLMHTTGLVDEVEGQGHKMYYVLTLPVLTRSVILNKGVRHNERQLPGSDSRDVPEAHEVK